MELDNIKARIRKLLALSTSNSKNESYEALKKAQELMVRYKILESEVSGNSPKKTMKKIICEHYYSTNSTNTYMSELADILSNNFCCVDFVSTCSRRHYIGFLGAENDVSLCVECMHFAVSAISNGLNSIWKDMLQQYDIAYIPTAHWNPMKVGYTQGYLRGLKEALQTQKNQNPDWGLILVVPKEAQEFLDSLQKVNYARRAQTISSKYYGKGYEDGKNFSIRSKLGSEVSLDKLT